MPSLSVLIPALNEEPNIEAAIAGVRSRIAEAGLTDVEILALVCPAPNGTRDKTAEIVRRLAAEDPRIRLKDWETCIGLGDKYRQGVEMATKDYVMMVPGDNENDPSSFPAIFRALGTADMVLTYTSNPEVRPWGRRVLSWFYTAIVNTIARRQIRYYNGINAYPREALLKALPKTTGFAYSAEIVLGLLRRGLTFVEVPIRIQPRPGPTKALKWKNFVSVGHALARFWGERQTIPREKKTPSV